MQIFVLDEQICKIKYNGIVCDSYLLYVDENYVWTEDQITSEKC